MAYLSPCQKSIVELFAKIVNGFLKKYILTQNVSIPAKKEKLTSIFIFILLCGASKGFIKVLKAFIKPFEAPQRSVKIKI